MKRILLTAIIASTFVACNQTEKKEEGTKEVVDQTLKTAYIDTEKLMKEYQESIDFENKYDQMSKRMQEELERDMKKFQNDVAYFQKNAQSKGMDWAMKQQKSLEQRERNLAEKQQNFMKKIQEEGAVERDSLVTKMKKFIADYGKEKGFDYVFGTGDAATVLYAKDNYNITDEIIRLMNDAYTKNTKTETKTEDKKDDKKEETTSKK